MRRVLRQVMTGLVSILVRTSDRCGDTNGSEGRTNASAMQTVASQPRADAATQRHWSHAPPQRPLCLLAFLFSIKSEY